MNYCTSCGKKIHKPSNFCNACGGSLLNLQNLEKKNSNINKSSKKESLLDSVSLVSKSKNSIVSSSLSGEVFSFFKKIIYLTILGFCLFVMNPAKTDFLNFAKETLRKHKGNEINPFVSTVLINLADGVTTRKDYYFWSIYTIDTSFYAFGNAQVPVQLNFIGILNNFIPTSSSDLEILIGEISKN